MKTRIETREYENSHGHGPRGRGSWAFQVGSDVTDVLWSPSMTYTEAKKWAREQAKKYCGPVILYVLP